jgi:response regulator RpfG family c-di-GMP phosphodiesterase
MTKTMTQREKKENLTYLIGSPLQEELVNCKNIQKNLILSTYCLNSSEFINLSTYNIIVADDEIYTRLSTVRTLKNIFKTLNLNVNIIEAEDGVETVYYIYKASTQGYKISLILSDENMNFINGVRSSIIIKELIDKKKMGEIPFYLVTAYDPSMIDKSESCNLTQVLEKPLSSKLALEIVKKNFIK